MTHRGDHCFLTVMYQSGQIKSLDHRGEGSESYALLEHALIGCFSPPISPAIFVVLASFYLAGNYLAHRSGLSCECSAANEQPDLPGPQRAEMPGAP